MAAIVGAGRVAELDPSRQRVHQLSPKPDRREPTQGVNDARRPTSHRTPAAERGLLPDVTLVPQAVTVVADIAENDGKQNPFEKEAQPNQ